MAKPKRGISIDSSPTPVTDLHFDFKNPRIVQTGIVEQDGEEALIETLWREMAVDEIAMSIAENGFFRHEPLFAAMEGGKLVVVEGNRRLAAVKLLKSPKLRQQVGATDLPRAGPAVLRSLSKLPVIRQSRKSIWQYVGFKHVNGPQVWQSYSKAYYIARVHDKFSVSLEQIANQIGDRHTTVMRLYRGWMALEQAENEGVFDREDRWKKHFSFSHLYTGLDYPGIQAFLGLKPDRSYKPNPVPKSKVANLGRLCEWLFGSKSQNKQPLVQSQNPDLKVLNEVLQDEAGLTALKQGLPLGTSHDISKGDAQLFSSAVQTAKLSLQKARGTVLTGYAGEVGPMQTAEDISELSRALLHEMAHIQSTSSKRKSKKSARKKSPGGR